MELQEKAARCDVMAEATAKKRKVARVARFLKSKWMSFLASCRH